MKQVRVFVANSSDVNIDIRDANVQSILKTGNRVAFFYEDRIFYATHANQTEWYSFTSEERGTGHAVPTDQNVLNANLITSNKGDQVEPFTISKVAKSSTDGDRWIEFVIADNAFKHEKLTEDSHVDTNLAYAYVHNADAGETVSDMYTDTNADKEDFQNVLAMIFRQPLTSVNHNTDGISKTLTSNDLVRRYEENNLVNYAIHTDRMVLAEGETTVAFENIPAGQYKFPIAKIVHATASNIAAVQQIVVSAFKSSSVYYIAKAFVTPAGMNIINEVREGCVDRDVSISVETGNGISTIYMNITFSSTYTENVWTCNANVKGLEHTRFPRLLANKFHGAVGTSYDCFNNPVILNEYTAANADKYQERYDSKLMYSVGYPYAIRINIKPNRSYTAYTPDFTKTAEKTYSLSIDGVEYSRYMSVSADTKSLIYDAAYEKPSGLLLFSFTDVYDKREYKANYKIEDLLDPNSVVYEVKNVEGRMFNVLDIDVTVSRGRANLSSVDGISFVAYAVLPSVLKEFQKFNATGFDLDSSLVSPASSTGTATKERTYNNNASSFLGSAIQGSDNSRWATFDKNAINTYCSGDNRSGGINGDSVFSICSMPYITIPREFKQQYTEATALVTNKLSIDNGFTLESVNETIKNVTGNRVSITTSEYDSLDKTSAKTLTDALGPVVAKKMLDQWNGEIVTGELYYFNTDHPYFSAGNEARTKQDTWTFTGFQSDIPNLIINKGREIYNIIFTIYRNAKRDEAMDISIDDITTANISLTTGGINTSLKCPVSLTRHFKGKDYTYRLVTQRDVSARVLIEHASAFNGVSADNNDTLKNNKQGIFSFLYKIEPDEGKTVSDYPTDDFLLGEDDYPSSKYDPKRQSCGYWLMCNPLLHTTNGTPTDFASGYQEYHADTHIIKKNNTYYYAAPYFIDSCNASSYESLPDAFKKSAKEIGMPLFSIVFFDVKAINPLSMNLRMFIQKTIKNYVESYLLDHPEATISNVPGISADNESITLNCKTAETSVLTTLQHMMTRMNNNCIIKCVYTDTDTVTNIQNFWPIGIANSGRYVKYGVYNYNISSEVDDWEFEFITD